MSRLILYRCRGLSNGSIGHTATPLTKGASYEELIAFAIQHAKDNGEAKYMEYPWGLQRNGLPRGYKIIETKETENE